MQRLSSAQIAMLGPRPEIAAVFFPKELLDSGWLSQQWFLCVDRTRDEGPTRIAHFLGYDLLAEHWQQLLPLALYDVTGFNVPLVLEATRGWSLRYIRSGEPMIDADPDGNVIPSSQYCVSAASLSSFRSFLGFMRSADHALTLNELVVVSQELLKDEWEKVKEESKRGALRANMSETVTPWEFRVEGRVRIGGR